MALEYNYRVVLVKNRKISKIIRNYKILGCAKNKFNKIKSENQVFYEKRITNHKKLYKVVYEILLLKKSSDETTVRQIYNDSGQLINEKINGGWTILDKFHHKEEESFYVYGLQRRLYVPEIITEVITPRISSFYQIIMVFNKIVIYNSTDIEVVLCKNINEAIRLYDFLFDFYSSKKVLNLIFLGKANKVIRSSLYDRMQKHTGLARQELYRTSTRS